MTIPNADLPSVATASHWQGLFERLLGQLDRHSEPGK